MILPPLLTNLEAQLNGHKGGLMEITLRREEPADYFQTENLTREAFWDVYQPGCDEHLIVHQIRSVPEFIPELTFIALVRGKLAGHIMYTKAYILTDKEKKEELLCLGPVSVLPSLQKQGIGAKLIRHSLQEAASLGYRGVLLFGDPAYYSRFGFVNAADYGITTADGQNFDAFMALELREQGLDGIRGKYLENPVFQVDPKELEAFEKLFPPKEKHKREGQFRQ